MKEIDYTLYLVTDRKLAGNRPIEQVVAEAIKGGVTIVQLREKDLGNEQFLQQARSLKSITDRMGVPLIINDRIDIAMACGAGGVHLGQNDMSCAEARAIAGKQLVIGISVSIPEEAILAEEAGADYLGVSPVFPTATKTDTSSPAGLDGLLAIRKAVRIPLVGIGGINESNAGEVIRAGADGVAVVSAVMAAHDPELAAMRIRSAMRRVDPR
jgi:thiamine-phosphate pyrophosphorylase